MQKILMASTLALAGLFLARSPAHAFGLMGADEASGVYRSQIQSYGEATIGSITARVTRGINPDGTNGSLGAFSEFTQISSGVTTIDFNQAGTKVGTNSYTFGDDSIVYSWDSGGGTGILNNRWAPSGAYGEVNTSNYLGVFQGKDVTISLNNNLNYFGIDWGALSSGNNFSFYNDDQLISAFTYEAINPKAPVRAAQHGGEGNGYLHFYANQSTGVFNKIKITQAKGGGFESDNHSLRYGETGFDFSTGKDVPFEAESTLGLILLAMGWAGHRLIMKSKLKKLAMD
jgi:hypothetical protein